MVVDRTRFKVNSPDIVRETIDSEIVIVNLANGTHYSLDQVGIEVWNLIEAGYTLIQILNTIERKFSDDSREITESVKSLLDQLQVRQFIVPVEVLEGQQNLRPFAELFRLLQIRSLKALKKYNNGIKSSRALTTAQSPVFTIISDDCWGYGPYNDYGVKYSTPFIDIRIEAPCYLELLKDLRGYVESPLTFTNTSKYKYINARRDKVSFPVARLKDKVELLFVHDLDENICRAKWERRAQRIAWNNLFIKFREDESYFRDEYLIEFDQLQYEHKVCFTLNKHPEFAWAISAPDYFRSIVDGRNIYDATKQYFDAVSWVTKNHGSDLSAYKIKHQSA